MPAGRRAHTKYNREAPLTPYCTLGAAAGLLCCPLLLFLAADSILHHQIAKKQETVHRARALEGMHPRVFSGGCSGGHAAGLLRQSGVVSSLATTTKEIETVHRGHRPKANNYN